MSDNEQTENEVGTSHWKTTAWAVFIVLLIGLKITAAIVKWNKSN